MACNNETVSTPTLCVRSFLTPQASQTPLLSNPQPQLQCKEEFTINFTHS